MMKEIPVLPMKCVFANAGVVKIDRIGAGIGIIVYSGASKIAAGTHVLRGRAPQGNSSEPAYYADTVIPFIIEEFKKKGAMPPFSVAVAGGASLMGGAKLVDIGSQLATTVKELLENAKLKVKMEQTGGNSMRSIVLDVDAGKIKIGSQ